MLRYRFKKVYIFLLKNPNNQGKIYTFFIWTQIERTWKQQKNLKTKKILEKLKKKQNTNLL